MCTLSKIKANPWPSTDNQSRVVGAHDNRLNTISVTIFSVD